MYSMILCAGSKRWTGKDGEDSFYPEVIIEEATWWLERITIKNWKILVLDYETKLVWFRNYIGHLIAFGFNNLLVISQDLTEGSLKTHFALLSAFLFYFYLESCFTDFRFVYRWCNKYSQIYILLVFWRPYYKGFVIIYLWMTVVFMSSNKIQNDNDEQKSWGWTKTKQPRYRCMIPCV